jgi:hypothetical protein
MDIADIAEEKQQFMLQKQLSQVATTVETIARTGHCLNCGEPCDGLFCCKECRDDYEHREKCRAIRGN